MTGLWYLASPYSKYPAGIDFAAADISKIAGKLIAEGTAVYSPIAHTHPIAIAAGLDPYDHTIWMPLDQHMMDAAEGMIVAMMDGWRESYGISLEITHFLEAGKPIHYYDPVTGKMAAEFV
ncbi:DUF1937 family protein [Phreatobacter sp. HK31-P]